MLLKVVLDYESKTHELAKDIAAQIKAGDVLLLNGPLGAGKTSFVQGLAKALGVAEGEVVSPTFVIAQKYEVHNEVHNLAIHHLDLYRIEDKAELDPLLRELSDDGVLVMEWAEKLGKRMFEESLTINFEYGDIEKSETQRVAELIFEGESWKERAVAIKGLEN